MIEPFTDHKAMGDAIKHKPDCLHHIWFMNHDTIKCGACCLVIKQESVVKKEFNESLLKWLEEKGVKPI